MLAVIESFLQILGASVMQVKGKLPGQGGSVESIEQESFVPSLSLRRLPDESR